MTARFRSVSLCLPVLLLFAVSGKSFAYDKPADHPRIFIPDAGVGAVADRCRAGGTHREFYEKLKAFSDSRIGAGKTDAKYLPNYALTYKIHRYWNETGYDGGGFEENNYWTFTRDALLASTGSWGIDSNAAARAYATDWIWEKLSSSDISSLAPKYGEPRDYIPDSQTWRDATTYNTMTSILRSLLYAGTSVDDGDYEEEYQKVCLYLDEYFARALDLQGGVGATGPAYETNLQFDRAWALEAYSIATGLDGWVESGKWKEEWGKWLIYSKVPHRDRFEPNQDVVQPVGSDSYKNVALLAARGQDPSAQTYTVKYWNDVLGRTVANYQNASLWQLVLWYDPDLPVHSDAASAKAVRLGADGMDHIYMTTGLGDEDATWACFEAGKNFYGHQHQDAGAFTIHRKGDLLIDSGYYGQYRSVYGDEHANNYYHRSTGHNTVAIYDPDELFYWGAAGFDNGPLANDGGQILPKSAPNYNSIFEDSTFSPGKMLAYETNDSYTYCQADLHNAYNQEALSESRDFPFQPNKLTHITREFAFLRPDYFIVFDRVGSVNPGFVKVWNMHVAAEPTVEGTGVQRAGNAQAGIWDYEGASIAHVTDTNPEYGQGSLFLKTLLPKDRTIRKIGGENRALDGYAYWIGGFDQNGRYDPTEGENWYWGDWLSGHEHNENNLADLTIGWGRIEVEATTPASDDLFLNVIYPCDASVGEMPDTRLIESENMVGVEIVNERVLLFGREETSGIDSVTYQVAPEDTSSIHTICNLAPSETYRVFRSGRTLYLRRTGMAAPDGAEEIISPAPVSTPAGLLSFSFSGENLFIQVSNVRVDTTEVDPLETTIRWETDIASDSQAEFGATPAYGSFSDLDPSLVTSHSILLTAPDVTNDVTCYFRVHSSAPGGQSGVSDGDQFRIDLIPPGPVTDLRATP